MAHMMVLIRHGQSEWNLKNLFTGWCDPDLTEKGMEEAKRGGRKLRAKGIRFDCAFTSKLRRAQKTCALVLDEIGQSDLPVIEHQAINERDYGALAGLNKNEAREKWGEKQVYLWRRSYDVPPPNGESLKDTGARVWPYFLRHILPQVMGGKTALIAAHGNSLRALIMAIEGLTSDQILEREIDTGVPMIYTLRPDTSLAHVEILN